MECPCSDLLQIQRKKKKKVALGQEKFVSLDLARGPGKANSIIAHVKFCVEGSYENIPQDPQRASRGWDIEAYKAT